MSLLEVWLAEGAALGLPSTAGLHVCLLGKHKGMQLSLKLLLACQGLSAVTLPLVGAESIWVGLGETTALRIYILVTANTLRIHQTAAFMPVTVVLYKRFWFSVHMSILYCNQ